MTFRSARTRESFASTRQWLRSEVAPSSPAEVVRVQRIQLVGAAQDDLPRKRGAAPRPAATSGTLPGVDASRPRAASDADWREISLSECVITETRPPLPRKAQVGPAPEDAIVLDAAAYRAEISRQCVVLSATPRAEEERRSRTALFDRLARFGRRLPPRATFAALGGLWLLSVLSVGLLGH